MTTTKRRRRGTGTIEGGDGAYRARLTTAAGRISLGVHPTEEAAETVLDAVRAELQGDHAKGLTLRAWGVRDLDRREKEGYAATKSARSVWRAHVDRAHIADLAIATIGKRDVQDWIAGVVSSRTRGARANGRRVGLSTAKNAINLVRAVLESAVERHIIHANPAAGVKVPRRASVTHEPWTYLRGDELDALLACPRIPVRDRLWIAFAAGTGLREGEQFNLRLADLRVDGAHPEVTVRFGSAKRGPKNTRGHKSRIRHVPLFGLGLQAARAWLAHLPLYCPSNPHGLVFPGPTGARRQPGKHLHRTVRIDGKPRPLDPLPAYLEAAGITRSEDEASVAWHSLRHTCATALVSGTWGRLWSLEEVKGLLGHKTISTTERYAHLAESALRTAAAETAGPTRKPTVSPRPVAVETSREALSARNDSGSHLRDLNSRPTVYETSTLMNDSDGLGHSEARPWPYEAQEAARAALEAIAGGGWKKAVDLLAEIAQPPAVDAAGKGEAAR